MGIGSIQEIKNFYINDVINFHRQAYNKVSKLYDEYKAKKIAESLEAEAKGKRIAGNLMHKKSEGEIKVDELMRENDLYAIFKKVFTVNSCIKPHGVIYETTIRYFDSII